MTQHNSYRKDARKEQHSCSFGAIRGDFPQHTVGKAAVPSMSEDCMVAALEAVIRVVEWDSVV